MLKPKSPQAKQKVIVQNPPSVSVSNGPKKNTDTSTWLTRVEAADMLSVALQTIANQEARGKLHPQLAYRKNSREQERLVRVYDPNELEKLRKENRDVISTRDPGALSSRAYAMFDDGRPEREIVRKLQLTPDAVSTLYERWKDGGGADLVINDIAKEELTKIVGPFNSVAELVECVTKLKHD